MTIGCKLARAVYTAAVSPDGPDPMMITSRGLMLVVSVRLMARRSKFALGPEQQPDPDEYCTQSQPRRPNFTLVDEDEAAEGANRGHHERRQHDERREDRVHGPARDRLHGIDGPLAHHVDG